MKRKREVYWHEDTAPMRYAGEEKQGLLRGAARWVRDIFAGLLIVFAGMFVVVMIMMLSSRVMEACFGGPNYWLGFLGATLFVVAIAMRPGRSIGGKVRDMFAVCGFTFLLSIFFAMMNFHNFPYYGYCYGGVEERIVVEKRSTTIIRRDSESSPGSELATLHEVQILASQYGGR